MKKGNRPRGGGRQVQKDRRGLSAPIITQTQQHNQMLRAALYYAAHFRWAVLPLHSIRGGRCTCGRPDCPSPGKHPLTPHGVRDATRDPATIRRWWTRWPWANVSVATGQASGFWVLDVDPDKGGEDALRELEAQHSPLPETVEALTGSGGRHLVFRYPGRHVPNKVALTPGLDVRGDGGYIVAPPSVHASGRRYEWEALHRPDEVQLAEAPAWLLALVADAGGGSSGGPTPPEEWRRLAAFGVSEGQRNTTVARLAGHLLRRGVDPYVTAALLLALNEARFRPPLPADEVLRTVNSIARREAARRGLLERRRPA